MPHDWDCEEGDCSDELRESLQRALDKTCKKNCGHGGGMIRIERADGSLLFQGTSGCSGCEKSNCDLPFSCNWPIEIASVTKMVTAACVLQMADEDAFDIDEPIMKYIHSRIPQAALDLGFGVLYPREKRGKRKPTGPKDQKDLGECVPCLRRNSRGGYHEEIPGVEADDAAGGVQRPPFPPATCQGGENVLHRIKISQCLNHTTGLPEYWDSTSFQKFFKDNPDRFFTPEECLVYACEDNMHFRPGEEEQFYYADTNYILLGYLMEEIDKKPLEEIYRSRVFLPLEMNDTYCRYREDPTGQRKESYPIVARYEGQLNVSGQLRQTAEWAGGGLVSTLEDVGKFCRAFVGRPGGKNDAVHRFFGHDTRSCMKDEIVSTNQYFKSDDICYGLGFMDIDYENKGHYWGHDGHGNVFAYCGQKKDGLTVVGTLNQLDNDWTEMWADMLEAIYDSDEM